MNRWWLIPISTTCTFLMLFITKVVKKRLFTTTSDFLEKRDDKKMIIDLPLIIWLAFHLWLRQMETNMVTTGATIYLFLPVFYHERE